MKKKGFQLAMSAIVTIIIAIVLVGMGVLLLNKFIGGAQDIKAELDERTDQQLSILLESGQRIAVPFNSFTLRRGDSQVVGVGILNIDEDTPSKDFEILVAVSDAFYKNNSQIQGVNGSAWVKYDASPVTINSREQYKTALLFTVPKDSPSGTYIFNVDVRIFNGPSLGLKKVYFTVP